MAAGASLLAIAILWPAPARDTVREAAIEACRALAARLRSDAGVARANTAVAALQEAFFATPHRPTGLSTTARTVVRLVDELRWLNDILAGSAPRSDTGPRACAVKDAAASVLDCSADLLDVPGRSADRFRAALAALREALDELERDTTMKLPAVGASHKERMRGIVSSLDPSFRAQESSYVVLQIARNVHLAATAERRGWVDRFLGRQPAGLPSRRSAAQERAGAHVERHSVWLQNSVRGAAGLGLAVLVADLSGVQHGFWVVFGTLSVLRSNALSTGQDVLRGLAGTTAGFVVGAVLVSLIGTDTTLLWALLPVAVLLAGLAPAAFSFAAGQAAFTLTLLILFNLLQPAGWRIGLVRIEDVVLGSGVSLVVGLLFWPRGAAAALRVALADAYAGSAGYLARAVEFGTSLCDSVAAPAPAPIAEAVDAAAASRRLDYAFRGYLAERGAKPVPLSAVTTLVTGVAGLRLAADAVLDLWEGEAAAGGDRGAARRGILTSAGQMTAWYGGFAASLVGRAAVPEPRSRDALADELLVEAVSQDLRSPDGQATSTGVRMIWTGDHLDAARRLQRSLVGPARATVTRPGP
jgi:hypothetical protein